MKKILITGGNGYIAKSIVSKLNKDEYEVTVVTRADFDLTDFKQTNAWFEGKYFDVVIHTAAKGGSRLQQDGADVLDSNLRMHYNLVANKDKFNRLLSFGSGAEIFAPNTPYGMSKKIIANSVAQIPNWHTLRVYAVFDENELDTRFIKANILRYIDGLPIEIHKNKVMDFFYMKDLISVIEYCLLSISVPKEMDCSYAEKKTLVDIAGMINARGTHKSKIQVNDANGIDFYCGNGVNLPQIEFVGLERGIFETYIQMKRRISNEKESDFR